MKCLYNGFKPLSDANVRGKSEKALLPGDDLLFNKADEPKQIPADGLEQIPADGPWPPSHEGLLQRYLYNIVGRVGRFRESDVEFSV